MDLDRMAKAKGFPDYATMIAWHQKQSQGVRNGGTNNGQEQNPDSSMPSLSKLWNPDGSYGGPLSSFFHYISSAIGRATGG